MRMILFALSITSIASCAAPTPEPITEYVEVHRPVVPAELIEPLPERQSTAEDPVIRVVQNTTYLAQDNDRLRSDRAIVFCLHRAAAAQIEPDCETETSTNLNDEE